MNDDKMMTVADADAASGDDDADDDDDDDDVDDDNVMQVSRATRKLQRTSRHSSRPRTKVRRRRSIATRLVPPTLTTSSLSLTPSLMLSLPTTCAAVASTDLSAAVLPCRPNRLSVPNWLSTRHQLLLRRIILSGEIHQLIMSNSYWLIMSRCYLCRMYLSLIHI